ncbi:hypothetical protein [Emticicia sp. BO119]|uniref:hypothetical protein n=1 Tax=Emticicia sp. BO119 TaxID=2757768 RepID=UPI0015F10EBF|nr:hypothetical protein [Emticicia sp. BO119]MBA4849005.1 hypothetical protein [Emticicia sp. BO119]
MPRPVDTFKKYKDHYNLYIQIITLIIAVFALIFSIFTWREALPSESNIDLRLGNEFIMKIKPLNVDNFSDSSAFKYRLEVYIPVSIMNLGGKPNIIKNINLKIPGFSNFAWFEVDNYSFKEKASPILVLPNTSLRYYVGFAGDYSKKGYWVPTCNEDYFFHVGYEMMDENEITQNYGFMYSFSKSDSIGFSLRPFEGRKFDFLSLNSQFKRND